LKASRTLEISGTLGINPGVFEKSLSSFREQNYFAASLNTEEVLITKMKKAYAELKGENLLSLR